MCDLIDLNSPDASKVLRKELASPLIPPPAGSGSDELCSATNRSSNLITGEKRDSLDNNPFDQVFKETAEYVRKKEDPFEMVLEKVNSRKKSRPYSVEFKDDFIPKHTKYADVLKMNKTLDESVIDNDLNSSRSYFEENSIIEDLNTTDLINENDKSEDLLPRILIQKASPLNNSILNYSAMNDSLIETNVNDKESAIRSLVAHRVSMCIQKGIMEAEGILNPNQHLKLINCRRSLSQSDRLSPKKFELRHRSHSIIDTKRKLSRSERSTLSSMPSIEFDDQLNKAFLQEQCSADNSVFLDLSNISEITRVTSISSAYNSSISLFSNGTMNQAFIRSGSSQMLPAITLSPANTRENFRSTSRSTIGSNTDSENVKNDISDLQEKFMALKMKISQNSMNDLLNVEDKISELSEKSKIPKFIINENVVVESSTKENEREIESEAKEGIKEERLIDVEVFVPKTESKSSISKNSFSDSSSDSVFAKSKTDKSIWSEAKKLAKTFEEMADDKLNTSGLDLLSSSMQFDFDQLPNSDDEIVIDNLIDLPASPSKPEVPPNYPLETKTESFPPNDFRKEVNRLKEIEMEFIEPKDPEKKIIATSLLLELEKLIKIEKNPDAEKLLLELEKVLGVKWENNTDLLETYLQNAKSNMQIDSQRKDVNKTDVENNDIKGNESNNSNEIKTEHLEKKSPLETKMERPKIRGIHYQSRIKKTMSRSFDMTSKEELSPEKRILEDVSISQVIIKNNAQSSAEKLKSQILGVRKRFSSDPNTLNPALEKKPFDSNVLGLKKSISSKEFRGKDARPEKQESTISSMANAVRNKLKQKSATGMFKKGPMKATIPFGNMQERESLGKKIVSTVESETPPKTSQEIPSVFTVTSSTPNSSITSALFKKSKSKPVASSTPDNKELNTIVIKPPSPRNRNFSCNISPVPMLAKSSNEKLNLKGSPKGLKMNVSPKRPSTPKARRSPRTPSGIPKYSPLPEIRRRRSLNDLNKSVKQSEPSQLVSSVSRLRKTSTSVKKIENETPKSPLKSINKMDLKVKPFNLISKLRTRNRYSEAEKENFS